MPDNNGKEQSESRVTAIASEVGEKQGASKRSIIVILLASIFIYFPLNLIFIVVRGMVELEPGEDELQLSSILNDHSRRVLEAGVGFTDVVAIFSIMVAIILATVFASRGSEIPSADNILTVERLKSTLLALAFVIGVCGTEVALRSLFLYYSPLLGAGAVVVAVSAVFISERASESEYGSMFTYYSTGIKIDRLKQYKGIQHSLVFQENCFKLPRWRILGSILMGITLAAIVTALVFVAVFAVQSEAVGWGVVAGLSVIVYPALWGLMVMVMIRHWPYRLRKQPVYSRFLFLIFGLATNALPSLFTYWAAWGLFHKGGVVEVYIFIIPLVFLLIVTALPLMGMNRLSIACFPLRKMYNRRRDAEIIKLRILRRNALDQINGQLKRK